MFQSAIKINQFQFWSFVGKIPRVLPYFLAKNRSFSSPFNLQSKSINFNVGHLLAKYQGYSLALWPKIAHFHHLSICNQTQSTSRLVSCRQNTKVMALLVGQKSLIFITFQSAIKINQFECWSFFGKIPRLQPYFLTKNRSLSSLFNLESKSINFNVGHFSAKQQAYSLTVWPKIAHFHHFSIYNQTQSTSSLVSCLQNTNVLALLFGQQSLIIITFNLQSKSINFNVGHFSAKYQGYSLTFWPIIAHVCIMFQSAIKINQFQFWSFVGKLPRVLPYFLANSRSFSSLFNLQSKSINFNVGHLSAKYQSYGLNFGQKSLMFL